jgi:hypothetical protein
MDDVNSVVSTIVDLATEGDPIKTDDWKEARLNQINNEKKVSLFNQRS